MELLIKRLNQLSSDLRERITSCELEDMDAYMAERELLFTELQQLAAASGGIYVTPEIRQMLQQLEQHDSIIIGRMVELRNAANVEIDKINKGKRSKLTYESGSYGDDSLFLDAKR